MSTLQHAKDRSFSGRFISSVSKDYPMFIQIKIYHEPYYRPFVDPEKRRRRDSSSSLESQAVSLRRSRVLISDIVLCNNFDLFCTFTFDRRKHNRQDIAKLRGVMTRWLHNSRFNHSPNLQYLVVPEFHKDGKSLHFHALLKNYNGSLKDSGITKNGRKVFNLTGWRAGFSTAVKIDDVVAVSRYLVKYLVKDMPLFPGKKRYFCSQGLKRPTIDINKLDSFLNILFRKRKSHFEQYGAIDPINNHYLEPDFVTQDFDFYKLQKEQLPDDVFAPPLCQQEFDF